VSITPPKTHDVLMTAAAQLAKAAPNSWNEFAAALAAYTQDRKDLCIQAPADKVLLAQGRAQQCVELSSLLKHATQPK
jgi:hypothetical protein